MICGAFLDEGPAVACMMQARGLMMDRLQDDRGILQKSRPASACLE